MGIISYAQNFEDVMLYRALKDIKDGFYVDVGAYDPTEDSVTKLFYEMGWHGINIEPNKEKLKNFHTERPRDLNLGFGVSDQEGEYDIFISENPGLSSLNEDIVKNHKILGWNYTKEKIQTKRLETILDSYAAGKTIHFLKIDVEGLERNVILSNDWKKWRPWILVIESTVPMSSHENHQDWESRVLEAGYEFVYADGLNRFYLSKEKINLKSTLNYPPNVFDQFTSNRIYQLQHSNNELRYKLHLETQKKEKYFAEIAAVYNSRSWKIIQVFRKIYRLFVRAH